MEESRYDSNRKAASLSLGSFFVEHPRSVGETYWQHMRMALYFSLNLAAATVCAAIHAFAPGLFERTASRIVTNLHRRMTVERRRQPRITEQGDPT